MIRHQLNALSKWGASHSNGRLAVIGAVIWATPTLMAVAMTAVIWMIPESTPEVLATPIAVAIYFLSIVMAFAVPVLHVAGWIIIPFAAWSAWRDRRRRTRGVD